LFDEAIEVHRRQRELRLARTIELAHPAHRLRDVVDCALDGREITAGALTEVRFPLQQGFDVQRYRRKRIVDVVRDAARHLSEGPQPLLLQDSLLALTQVVVGLLQAAVERRLMGGQAHVAAQLPQKLAVAAGKTICLPACGHQQSGHLALGQQGHCHQ
jgi:hypothetical protein